MSSNYLDELIRIRVLLERIEVLLAEDRKQMWRVLAAVILGAFGLVGLKLALP